MGNYEQLLLCYYFFSQGKWEVPLPKVKGVSEAEVFKVVKSGKSKSKDAISSNLTDYSMKVYRDKGIPSFCNLC